MTRPPTSRDLRRPLPTESARPSSAEMTLVTARRLADAYCQLFTIISESGIRVWVPVVDTAADQSDNDELQTVTEQGTLDDSVLGERLVCCGGKQENLRRRLHRVMALPTQTERQEARRTALCGKLIAARGQALARAGLDRRVVDRFVDELIALFDERDIGAGGRQSAERVLQYDVPVSLLRRQTSRLRAARAHIHQHRAQMVNDNYRLVMRVARRFMGRGLPFEDLVQEGNLGLMRAIDKFDPDRGFKFSTYAMWWIRQGVARAIVEQSRTVRLPVHLSEMLSRIRRMDARLTTQLQRKPEPSELAKALDLSEERLSSLLQKVPIETSMQKPLGEGKSEFGDLVADENAEQGLGFVEHNTLKQLLTAALDRLDSRSRYVVQAHHGLSGARPLTLGDIGKVLGLSRERVRQIENEAFQRLKKAAREQHLDDFV